MILQKISEEYESGVSPWRHLASMNDFLQKIREEHKEQEESINTSIILNSAVVIEGIVSEMLQNFFLGIYRGDSLSDRLKKDLEERIDKSGWQELQKLYKILLGKKLSDDVSPKVWVGIQSLFNFRNLIAHGSSLKISTYTENRIRKSKVNGKYETIYSYLATEVKVIKKIILTDGKFPTITLLTNGASDFYWQTALNFVREFCIINKDNLVTDDIIKQLDL